MKEFLKSKKTKGFLLGLISAVAVQYLGLSEEQALKLAELITGMVMAYLAGQGLADHGKGKVQVENGIPQ